MIKVPQSVGVSNESVMKRFGPHLQIFMHVFRYQYHLQLASALQSFLYALQAPSRFLLPLTYIVLEVSFWSFHQPRIRKCCSLCYFKRSEKISNVFIKKWAEECYCYQNQQTLSCAMFFRWTIRAVNLFSNFEKIIDHISLVRSRAHAEFLAVGKVTF